MLPDFSRKYRQRNQRQLLQTTLRKCNKKCTSLWGNIFGLVHLYVIVTLTESGYKWTSSDHVLWDKVHLDSYWTVSHSGTGLHISSAHGQRFTMSPLFQRVLFSETYFLQLIRRVPFYQPVALLKSDAPAKQNHRGPCTLVRPSHKTVSLQEKKKAISRHFLWNNELPYHFIFKLLHFHGVW